MTINICTGIKEAAMFNVFSLVLIRKGAFSLSNLNNSRSYSRENVADENRKVRNKIKSNKAR